MNQADNTLYDAAASREIDAYAIEHLGVSGYMLMQRAADAAFASLLQNFPGIRAVTVFCGKGNNAGDAYLVAQRAFAMGLKTQVLAVVSADALSGDALTAYRQAESAGVGIEAAGEQTLVGDVVVDGLLGTGLNGAPRGAFATAIERINAANKPVLSVDIPSGVSADTGAVFGAAVKADVTVSFITRKLGLYTGAGISYAGVREFADLGVPPQMYVAAGLPRLFWTPDMLPALDVNTYKHRQGHVGVIGGDEAMPGAVAMASHAALRVGAGMVTALTRAEHRPAIVARTPEVMVQGFTPDAVSDATALLQRADLLVLGPGLGRSDWSQALYACAQASQKPTVLDADGLYWLAQFEHWSGGPLSITPHVAEAARLLKMSADDVQSDRLSAAKILAERFACHGVLKGAGSIVFDAAGQRLCVCAHGNPGMATAGMGDVLSGVLGGILGGIVAGTDTQVQSASRADMYAATSAAVALHSAAADHAALGVGMRSLVATDVISALPQVLLGYAGAKSTTKPA